MHLLMYYFKTNNESLYCTPETKIILYVNSTSAKKQNEKKTNNRFAILQFGLYGY